MEKLVHLLPQVELDSGTLLRMFRNVLKTIMLLYGSQDFWRPDGLRLAITYQGVDIVPSATQ